MAMLAEPRQRKRYNLVPRGKALYEDDSRFGTKMLEKMGWSKGKGLGAKEEGALDFVRVRYKNDAEGFGYEQRDDQWTQHEDGFNGLLKSLNGEEDSVAKIESKKALEQGNNSDDDIPRMGFGFQNASVTVNGKTKSNKPLKLKEKISGISLEEKSKQSKARVHYKKFTRGKDLSQYSEKDLANIFGKKVEDEQKMAVNDFYQQLNNTFNKKPEAEDNDDDTKEKLSGVQMISTGVSVADYFKNKMDQIKNRRNGPDNLENNIEQETSTEVQEDDSSKKKKKKKEKKSQELVEENGKNNIEKEESNTSMFSSGVSVADYFKNKMEEMKKRQKAKNSTENKTEQDVTIEVQDDMDKKKKKNKKEYKNQEETTELNIIEEEQVPIKTKKSKKLDTIEVEDANKTTEDISEEKPQKKKRKNEANTPQELVQEIDLTEEPEKKKNKSIEPTEAIVEIIPMDQTNCGDAPLVQEIDLTQEPEIKKKKKNKIIDPLEAIEVKAIAEKKETIPNTADALQEIVHEIDLTQEPEKNKKKKNKSIDALATVKVNNTPQNKSKQELESSGKQETIKKTKKSKSKDVSATTVKSDIKSLTLDDIKTQYELCNIYQISSFCAEKFRHINLNHFMGSTLPQVDGYAFSQDIQLNVTMNDQDEERITNMWKSTLNKYNELEKPKKTYKHYIKDVIRARKTKQKRPKLHVKTWKRKNAFQTI